MLESIERADQVKGAVGKGKLRAAGADVIVQLRRWQHVHDDNIRVWDQGACEGRKPRPQRRRVSADVQHIVFGSIRLKEPAEVLKQDISFIQIERYSLRRSSIVMMFPRFHGAGWRLRWSYHFVHNG